MLPEPTECWVHAQRLNLGMLGVVLVPKLRHAARALKGAVYRPSNKAHNHGLGPNHVFKVHFGLGPIKNMFSKSNDKSSSHNMILYHLFFLII
jgi:hypothetical protein